MGRVKLVYGQPPSSDGPWKASPFTVEMTPTAAVKRSGVFSSPLYLGLLVQLPDPDGIGAVELDHPGYLRQLIELVPRSSAHLTIPRPVLFEIHDCPTVVGLGLFDGDAMTEGYGVLRSSRTAWRRPEKFEFPSHQILIKRPTGPA